MSLLPLLALVVVCTEGQNSDSIWVTATIIQEDGATSSATVGSGYGPFPEPTNLPVLPSPEVSNISSVILGGSAFVGDGLCNCDLLVDRCDRLCCCDRDCSAESQVLFDCSSASQSRDECIRGNEILRTSLIPCTCSTASLFCVVSEQDPSNQEFGPPVTLNSAAEFTSYESIYSVPRSTPEQTYHNVEYGSVYRVGDPILMIPSDVSDFASYFTIPSPFNGRLCHDGNPITYYNDVESTCERRFSVLNDSTCSLFSASLYFENISVFQVPSTGTFGPSPVQIDVSEFNCVEADDTQACEFSPPTYVDTDSTCFDAVLKVVYTIIHDGSGRIRKVTAEITTGNLQDTLHFIQQFSVKFMESTQGALQRSGNPGYLEGEIVLAGLLNDNTVRLAADRNRWLHLKDSRTDCGTDKTLPVRFLYNVQTSCFINVLMDDLVNDCTQVRLRAISALTTSSYLDYVGRFGNSNPEDLSQWVPILNETIRSPQSQFLSAAVCTDVVTSLTITIIYSYTGNLTSPSTVISGVKYTYLSQSIPANLLQNGQMAVQVSLQFIDVSLRPQHTLKSLKLPVFSLPQDFLYPFIVASSCFHLSSNFILISAFHLLLYMKFKIGI